MSATGVAAPPPATAARYDTLVVRAPARNGPGPAVGAVVTRLDLEDPRGARDLADALGAVAGLQVRRYGAAGASAVPSMRGSSPSQLRLFVDGMPLDDAQTGLVDLARLPLERFGTADVHRGGVPVRLGGIGGAGAINLRTRRQASGWDLGLAAGSFGAVSARAIWGHDTGSGSVLVLAHGRRADNDFRFTDHRWTFHETDDDVEAVRENAWLREHGFFLSAAGDPGGDWRVRGWAGFLRRDGGRPGPVGGNASPHASVRYDRLDGYLSLDWREDLLRAEVAAARSDDLLDDPAGEVANLPPGMTTSRGEDVALRLSVAPRIVSGGELDLAVRFGAEWRGQWFDENLVGLDQPLRHRDQTTAFAALDAALAGPRLRLEPSLRWQGNRDDFPPVPALPHWPEQEGVEHRQEDWSPAVGLVWDASPGRLAVEAHAARTVRVPTWVELFGHRGGIVGDRELAPEEIASWDVGVTARPGDGLSVRAAFFAASTDETIVYVANSQQTSRPVNAGATRNRGLELELWWRPAARLRLEANATFQRARDAGGLAAYDGKRLPFLPDREFFGRLAWTREGLAPWIELQARSGNYRDRYNTPEGRAPARHQWHLGVDRSFRPGWPGPDSRLTVSAAILNLTDNSIYDVEGYPLPGRSWRASVQLKP
ncbi:MAG: TonB-dependent receptor [bacterium]|nr:TonB-dependent receptor [bacterium]